MSRRKSRGFTLIEIMIVVGIIAIMLAGAVMSVASGRGAVKMREATRGVIQHSRYATALALLRQKPVVVTYFRNGVVEVRISGEDTSAKRATAVADPIYREVNEVATLTAEERAEEEGPDTEPGGGAATASKDKESKLFFTKQVLDPDVLAKEDSTGEYEGVTFEVEVLGEDGAPLDPAVAASRSLRRPEREGDEAQPALYADGTLQNGGQDDEDALRESDIKEPVSVTYETNGNIIPYRVTIRPEDATGTENDVVIEFSRSGKATVLDGEEDAGGKRGARRRR